MRVALHHQLLGFRACCVAAELTPSDKELLVGSESVDRRFWLAARLLSFLESKIGYLHPAEVPDRFTQHQIAIQVNGAVNGVTVKLPGNAGGFGIELLAIVCFPPVLEPALSVELATPYRQSHD